MFITLKRIFKSGWTGFSRDGELAIPTVFIILIALGLLTSIFLLRDVSQVLISTLQEKIDISVYFKEGAPEEDILSVKDELSKIPEIKEVKYVSKIEALDEFVKRHQNDQILLESLEEVGDNPFLASLSIKARQASQYGTVSNFLSHPSFEDLIEKVDYYQRKPVIERIFSLTSVVNKTGIFLSIILIIVAILVTFNTIRLAIYNSREEIKIQRLVGASSWFIRGPFLVQGAVSGVMAALICLSIFSLLSWFLSPKVEFFFPDLNLFNIFVNNLWLLILIQFVAGISLGLISSAISVRKYLKI